MIVTNKQMQSLFVVLVIFSSCLCISVEQAMESDSGYLFGFGINAELVVKDKKQNQKIGFFVEIAGADAISDSFMRFKIDTIGELLSKHRQKILSYTMTTASVTYILATVFSNYRKQV